jgi:hypothetical protein
MKEKNLTRLTLLQISVRQKIILARLQDHLTSQEWIELFTIAAGYEPLENFVVESFEDRTGVSWHDLEAFSKTHS